MVFPLTFIHESGHAQYCLSSGALPSMKVDLFVGRTDCEVQPDNHVFASFWYSFSGGALASLVALLPIALTKRLIGRIPKWIWIPSIALSGAQFVNAMIESYWTNFYLANTNAVVLITSFPVIVVVIVGAAFYLRRKPVSVSVEPKLQQASESKSHSEDSSAKWERRIKLADKITLFLLGNTGNRIAPDSKAYAFDTPCTSSDNYVERLNKLCWGNQK
ncbi:MAG: hypothetical protein HMLIMOIP_001683 [Candidatus Nitrosomirales archaeon]|jgi:hypothetical protein